jgi:hypothetical protein
MYSETKGRGTALHQRDEFGVVWKRLIEGGGLVIGERVRKLEVGLWRPMPSSEPPAGHPFGSTSSPGVARERSR